MFFVYSITPDAVPVVVVHDYVSELDKAMACVVRRATDLIRLEEGSKKAETAFKETDADVADYYGYFLRTCKTRGNEVEVWRRSTKTVSGWLGRTSQLIQTEIVKTFRVAESDLDEQLPPMQVNTTAKVISKKQLVPPPPSPGTSAHDQLIDELKQRLEEMAAKKRTPPQKPLPPLPTPQVVVTESFADEAVVVVGPEEDLPRSPAAEPTTKAEEAPIAASEPESGILLPLVENNPFHTHDTNRPSNDNTALNVFFFGEQQPAKNVSISDLFGDWTSPSPDPFEDFQVPPPVVEHVQQNLVWEPTVTQKVSYSPLPTDYVALGSIKTIRKGKFIRRRINQPRKR